MPKQKIIVTKPSIWPQFTFPLVLITLLLVVVDIGDLKENVKNLVMYRSFYHETDTMTVEIDRGCIQQMNNAASKISRSLESGDMESFREWREVFQENVHKCGMEIYFNSQWKKK